MRGGVPGSRCSAPAWPEEEEIHYGKVIVHGYGFTPLTSSTLISHLPCPSHPSHLVEASRALLIQYLLSHDGVHLAEV